MRIQLSRWMAIALLAACSGGAGARAAEPATAPEVEAAPVAEGEVGRLRLSFGLEAKANYRDSQELRVKSPFPFPPDFLPPGASQAFLETASEGQHLEVSVLTLFADARWGENLMAHAKVDLIDLYDRNPTSSDKKVDVDELWIRFGSDPTAAPKNLALYAKVGKFGHFERQNDRHLESYGLVSTAFNRFEDQGLELGLDFGRHVYLRGSFTQGNPVFFRDPNALAGDNGSPSRDPDLHSNPDPAIRSGFPILYDAEVEDIDTDGDLETGGGLGVRFGDRDEGLAVDLLGWTYRRKLAKTVQLEGTFYGGDLDLLNGPFDAASLPIHGDRKQESGGNLWMYWGGFSLFGQFVDQKLAGMKRTGYEAEAAWRFELPLAWAVGGRQLFPSVQPALRYSHLDPKFAGGSSQFPAPSVRWKWEKIDYGVRMAIVAGVDLTAEYADNTMTLASGAKVSEDELLVTLRWRIDP
ncbi:MAG: hypothetical protein U0X73_16540 [Thermoanaerobaculia bacterium]